MLFPPARLEIDRLFRKKIHLFCISSGGNASDSGILKLSPRYENE